MYNLLEYLEQTAGRFPDKTAFEDVNGAVTYGQLMQRAKAAGWISTSSSLEGR